MNGATREPFWSLPDRRIVMGMSAVGAVFLIAVLTAIFPKGGRLATLVLDRTSPHFPYPFTIQNFEHLLLLIGVGQLFVRWRVAMREQGFMRRGLLPEDDHTVLQWRDLGPLRRNVARQFDGEHGFLPSLIDTCILQFQSSRSVDQAVAVMNASLELIEHRVDMRYNLIRYIAWLIPTLGFIGTVIGLGASLAEAGSAASMDLKVVAKTLAVGFDCTMVALVESAFLVFLLHIAQENEEQAVNQAGTYTLRNLINRLYEG